MNKMQKNGKNSKKQKGMALIMKTDRFSIIILLICSLLLSACGGKKENSKTQAPVPKTVLNRTLEEEETENEEPKIITYRVILENKMLSLYEVNGESKKLITKMEINPEFYPAEDISKLKKGIEAYCMEDGYEILENFAN